MNTVASILMKTRSRATFYKITWIKKWHWSKEKMLFSKRHFVLYFLLQCYVYVPSWSVFVWSIFWKVSQPQCLYHKVYEIKKKLVSPECQSHPCYFSFLWSMTVHSFLRPQSILNRRSHFHETSQLRAFLCLRCARVLHIKITGAFPESFIVYYQTKPGCNTKHYFSTVNQRKVYFYVSQISSCWYFISPFCSQRRHH